MDLGEVYEMVGHAVAAGKSTPEAMAELMASCNNEAPSPAWQQIAALDFAQGGQVMADWLRDTLTHEPPSEDIQAFFFGLFTTDADGGASYAQLYVCGSDCYDPDDETGDWVCDPAYFPEGRYAPRALYQEIDALLASDKTAFDFGEEAVILGYTALVVRDLMHAIEPSLLLGDTEDRHVAIGYDDGDVLVIGRVTRNGFEPPVMAE